MGIVHIVTGSPGVGKTTYGLKLARDRSACFLDIDTVSETFVRKTLKILGRDPKDRDSSFFKENFRSDIYKATFKIAKENCSWQEVVVVGPFTQEIRQEDWLLQLRNSFDCEVKVYYIYCQPYERKARILGRGNPRDENKIKDWDRSLDYYGEESRPKFQHEFIDTSSETPS